MSKYGRSVATAGYALLAGASISVAGWKVTADVAPPVPPVASSQGGGGLFRPPIFVDRVPRDDNLLEEIEKRNKRKKELDEAVLAILVARRPR